MFTDSYGVDLVFKMTVALTGATGASVFIQPPPSGNRQRQGAEKAAQITNESTGEVTYRTVDGDFPNTGVYKLQAIVYFGETRKLRSEIVEIEVEGALS